MTNTVYRTCNVCEAMCGMVFTVDDGRITDVRGDKEDVFSRGHICPKGPAMREVYEDPDRLRQPVRRTATGWQKISWEEAFAEAADRLSAIQRKHGHDAVGLYLGNPTVHNHGTVILAHAFARALRTHNRFDANSQDANPKLLACLLMYGDQLSVTVPDVDRTDYMLMLGANPAASNGSLMTLGDVKGRLRGIRERGGKLVLVDPRRTETAAWADEHIFIRPGGDAAFVAALLHEILPKVDGAALARTTKNLDELRAFAARFPPEKVAAAVGIDAAVIKRIAADFAAAKRAVAYGRVGTCQNLFGPTASWLIEALNVVTGNFDREGGNMFPSPAADAGREARRAAGTTRYGRYKSRVRGLPELGGQLPGATMAEEIETPGKGQIRGFITLCGNPVLSTPNGERLARALAGLDTMVAIDFYINETTRHAHLILPPMHALEQGHYDMVFHSIAVRNTAKWSEAVVAPEPGALADWEILYELGMRLGGLRMGNPLIDRLLKAAWRLGFKLSPDRVVDFFLRRGKYKLSLKKLRQAPHGIDLGPLVPSADKKVLGGKVDLAPADLAGDAARLEAWVGEARADLVLIGRRHLRTNNSWMHNVTSLVKGPDRAQLYMHADDARRLGLADGAAVAVKSRVGEVTATLAISDSVQPGVVCLPHGYGHAAAKETLRIAGPLPGPNINALTDELYVDPILGTAILNGVPVQVANVPPA